MILADTSIWIDHFRSGDAKMVELLSGHEIAIHPFIVAELALGSLRERKNLLFLLDRLPQLRVAQLPEVRSMIEGRRLYSLGLGLTDVHLIASLLLDSSALLWTRDKQLRRVAKQLGVLAGLE